MVVVIGWRGLPGMPDEPQHVKQGRVMEPVLDALGLPWTVLPQEDDAAGRCLDEAVAVALQCRTPYLLLASAGTFADSGSDASGLLRDRSLPSREEALVELVAALGPEPVVVATTGMLSRELFEHRSRTGSNAVDFLTIGGMGHAASIALGLANTTRDREVWCLDGDGALLMHLGGLAVIADHAPATYFHAVFNNGVHDSVGGQRTSIDVVDIPSAVQAVGYRAAITAIPCHLADAVATLRARGGPALMEIHVRPGARPDLGRPTHSPAQGKRNLMARLGSEPG
jgi:phosphonopyruvate decarboxylase